MSLAEELLASTSKGVPTHAHPVPDTDTYFVIDPITRRIENTNRKKSAVMQYDHNSERFTFELPRYIDGHDMLECTSITVNVDNIETVVDESIMPRVNSDAPDMTDLRVHPSDPEKIVSSWLISRNSTQLAGTLSFSIEYKCADVNGNVVYEWSTDIYNEIEVKPRKKNSEAAVIEHTDLLEQWRAQIFGAGDSVMADIGAEGAAQVAAVAAESESQQRAVTLKGAQTLESIPEDYTETNNMADEAVRSKGDAIICEAAGESIVLKDSSNDHIRGLKLFGKSKQVATTGAQLCDEEWEKGFISVTGTNTETSSGLYWRTKNYINVDDGKPKFLASVDTSVSSYHVFYYDSNKTFLTTEKVYSSIKNLNNLRWNTSASYIRFYAENTSAIPDFRAHVGNVMVSYSEDATYEPYTGGKPAPNPEYPQEIVSVGSDEAADISIFGKNLVNIYSPDVTETNATAVIDGNSIVIKTTVDNNFARANIPVTYPTNTPMTISFDATILQGCDFMSSQAMPVYMRKGSSTGPHVNLEITADKRSYVISMPDGLPAAGYSLWLYVKTAADFVGTVEAKYENIQIELGSVATTYEPYVAPKTLALTRALPGIPVTSGGNYTDSDGQQWICDEVNLERGVYVQRVAEYKVTGMENWTVSEYQADGAKTIRFDANISNVPGGSNLVEVLCTHYPFNGVGGGVVREGAWIASNPKATQINLRIAWYYDTVDELVAHLTEEHANGTPVTFYYALTNPIETPLTAEEIAAFKILRTNYPNTTILNDAGAWMSVKYNADTKTYIDEPKVLKLVDSSTGVVYELKIVDGNLTINPV